MLKVYIVTWVVASVLALPVQPDFNKYGFPEFRDKGIPAKDSFERYNPVRVVRWQRSRGFFSRDSALAFIAAAPSAKPADTTVVGTGWVENMKLDSTFWRPEMKLDTLEISQ